MTQDTTTSYTEHEHREVGAYKACAPGAVCQGTTNKLLYLGQGVDATLRESIESFSQVKETLATAVQRPYECMWVKGKATKPRHTKNVEKMI